MRKYLLSVHDCHISDNMPSCPIVCADLPVYPSNRIDRMRVAPVSGGSIGRFSVETPRNDYHRHCIANSQFLLVGSVQAFLLACPLFTSGLHQQRRDKRCILFLLRISSISATYSRSCSFSCCKSLILSICLKPIFLTPLFLVIVVST